MIAVASLELCGTLFGLSNWRDTTYSYRNYVYLSDKGKPRLDRWEVRRYVTPSETAIPAYDLWFLLWKLPPYLRDEQYDRIWLAMTSDIQGSCWMVYQHVTDDAPDSYQCHTQSDTPENVACKLATELFKQGILKKQT